MPKTLFRGICLLVILCATTALQAQLTEAFRDRNLQYHDAVQHMNNGKFEAARQGFGSFLAQSTARNDEYVVNATYYQALSAMELFHKDAKFMMQEFLLRYPESIWYRPASLALARYSFSRRDYKDAISYFSRLRLKDYDADTQDEIRFKKGFAAFELGDLTQARESFFPLVGKEGPYSGPVHYYYGHIAYTEGNYETALKALRKANEDESFAPVVPYYIAQILHYQEKYDELIDYAAPLVDSTGTKRKEEIAHLIGNAYYQQQRYAEAVPYLELYMKSTYNPVPSDAYQMAYAYYRTGNFKDAISHFATASKSDDPALVQIATYQMADAYLQLGEKKFAQNAFRAASQMDQDREVTEDALFNHAKLAYELSFDPFHEAIQAFDRYLKAYPDSPRKDDAYAFLLKVHLATKNYPAAMEAMDRMQRKGPIERANYQKAAYNHAVQLMRQGKHDEALQFFQTALSYNEDGKLTALTHYWKGDLYYRKGDYAKAVANYNTFAAAPSAYGTAQFNNAQYSIGYSQFKLNNHGASLDAFRKFVASPGIDKRRHHDALQRIGDLQLVRREYDLAIRSFNDAMGINNADGDYARFQIAMAYGYKDDHARKAEELQKLFKDYPASSLAAVARFELGDSYFLQNRLPDALSAFNTVVDKHSDSPYRKRALLRRGLVQYRQGDYDAAIASYKLVVKDYGVDAESREAIAVLRNIYLDLGRIDEYSAWLASVPNYSVSPSEIDSLSYRAAENLVADGKCEQAVKAFSDYINKYPNGLFLINAYYYRADCRQRANEPDKALDDFTFVITQPTSQFTEASLLAAAGMRYRKQDYSEALLLFTRLRSAASFSANALEADAGIMRSHYRLDQYAQARDGASEVLKQSGVPDRLVEQARLIRGKSAFKLQDFASAKEDFAWLATNAKGVEGAEAKYLIAEIAFKQNELNTAEKEIFELVQGYAGFDDWKVKGFLLLAEVYIAREDYFQARATLQSIIDNVQDPRPVEEARAAIRRIADIEEAKRKQGEARKRAEQQVDDPYEDLIDQPSNSEQE